MTRIEYLYQSATLRRIWREGRIDGATFASRTLSLIQFFISQEEA